MTSQLNFDTLTRDDFEAHDCPRLTLTHRDMTWDLSTTIYEYQENAMLNYKDDLSAQMLQQGDRLCLLNLCVCLLTLCVCQPCEDAVEILSDETFANVL